MKKLILFLTFFLFTITHCIADESVKIKAKKVGEYVVVNGVNNNPFSITVAFSASIVKLKSEKKLPLLFVLAANEKKEVLRLKILKNNFKYKAHYNWTIGSKDAKYERGNRCICWKRRCSC